MASLSRRLFSTAARRFFNKPTTSKEMPRCGGIATMFRLPTQVETEGLDACFLGVPFDSGTSNRNGTKFGPRRIRDESVLIRVFNQETGATPFDSIQVADVGDVYHNPFDIRQACQDIKQRYDQLIVNGCRPLTAGGDHTITYPILQSIKEKYGPVGLIHVDAHTDTYGPMYGYDIWHGNTFRLAVDEGLLDCKKVWQIGLRGSGHSAQDAAWGASKGFHTIPAYNCWHRSLTPLMADIRKQMGDTPVYISFDIDGLDPAFAPGTGTPEIGGLSIIQGMEIVRGCRGLNVVGADVVEVSPPYDLNGMTCVTAANLLFELLCILPGVHFTETAFRPAYPM